MDAWYDKIGVGYKSLRVPDEKIAAMINTALEGCSLIVNVGAGTGSYEPSGCSLIAIEPSHLMLSEYRGKGLCVRGVAEQLPLPDQSVDAGMAVLTLHHWLDWQAGLAELFRVSRDTVVIFTHKPDLYDFWLLDYFPQIREIDQQIFSTLDEIESVAEDQGWQVNAIPVAIPWNCTDGFLGAYWRRPEAYFEAEVRRSISTFNRLDPDVVEETLARLKTDLESGQWDRRFGDLRSRDALDIGYRLLVISKAVS